MKLDRTPAGPVVFVAITLVLTWATSALMMGEWSANGAPTTRLLRASLLYAAVVGWQPLFALWLVRRVVDRAFLDHGQRTISRHYTWFTIVLPILRIWIVRNVQQNMHSSLLVGGVEV